MTPKASDDDLLTVDQAAQLLQVHPATVHRIIDRGELRVMRLGGERHRPVRINRVTLNEDMAAWAERSAR
jgi:excisionase family DNA binding protein